MTEADVQSKFAKWVRESGFSKSCAIEIKLCHGTENLAFSAFEPQQLPCLYEAKHGALYKKLSDADRSLKPFDCFILAEVSAYILACWYTPRQKVRAYWIDIDDFLEYKGNKERGSLSETQAYLRAKKFISL